MAEYVRPGAQRFFVRGMALIPQDALKPDEVGYIRNMRTYQNGTLEPRFGLDVVTSAPIPDAIHSLFRIDDWSSLGAGASSRYVGANTNIYRGPTTSPGAFALSDNNYSGLPLTGVIAAPVASPKPWLYIGDSVRIQKFDAAGNHAPIGCHQPIQPSDEPSAILAPLQILPLDADTALATWVSVGAFAGAPAAVSRVNTVAANVIYDIGTTGACVIVPTDFSQIIIGTRVTIGGGSPEDIVVAEVHPAVGSTTVAAVIFDAGGTGYCTVQPTTSLATGQLEAPTFNEYQQRYSPELTTDLQTTPALIRTVDFAVNSTVSINGGAPVRIISVAMGIDGVISFRCYSPAGFAAGATIVGVASFRTTTGNAHANGDTLLEQVNQQVITNPSATDPVVGGVQLTAISGGIVDGSQITLGALPRATQPEDDICLAFKADLLTYVTEVRFYLNVDATLNDFLSNYYFHAWRANDLIAAIQATNAGVTSTLQAAKQNVVLQQNVDLGSDQPGTFVPPKFDAITGDAQFPGTMVNPASSTPASGSDAIGLTATSRQLQMGNNQWILLRCKVKDLIRVGMDSTRTLANINAIQITVQTEGTVTPITVSYADFYLSGGFGPDVRETLPTLSFCYRHRSSATGAIGNPSPPLRGGISPRRQRVTLQGTASTEATVDLDDWFARGASLTGWAYLGSAPTGTVFNYDSADSAVDGGPTVAYDHHQPWPVSDLPRTCVVNVAGTAIKWVSGDTFNTGWAPGSQVLVNGLSATIYAVASSTLLFVNENVGSGNNLAATIPEPIILAQPLPAIWGGEVNGVVTTFACGDPTDPTALHWTNGNDPDTTTDANWLFVANEQLQQGGFYNRTPFVFSSENLYEIQPTFGVSAAEALISVVSPYRATVTPCGKGLWCRWGLCVTPYGFVFVSRDGIYLSNGGPAVDLTDPDLRPIFPNEGSPGQSVRGVIAPLLTSTDRLRLQYIDSKVFFDYLGTDGNDHTLIYDFGQKGWLYDQYDASGIRCRLTELVAGVNDQILGAADGNLYQYDGNALLDGSTPISWEVWTPNVDGGDARMVKQFGDVMLDCLPGATLNGFTITPVADNGLTVLGSVVGAAAATRTQYIVDINNGQGILSRNLGIQIAGMSNLCDINRPLLYLWEPSLLAKVEDIQERATDWDDLGYKGAKFVQGIIIRANTFGQAKTLRVEYDGGALALNLTINHNGETEIAYPLDVNGWTPFLAQLVRLRSLDTVPWMFLGARWVAEPAPENATQWETQDTTFDLPGFLSVVDGVFAYSASAPQTLTVYHDANPLTYTLPSTGGAYQRVYVRFQAAKGKSARFRVTGDTPSRIYKRDCTIRVLGWGQGYGVQMPFGGPSRTDGAAI